MTEDKKIVTDEELHAYVDGLLTQNRRREIEFYLDENPSIQGKVNVWMAQNQDIQTLFNSRSDEPIPSHLNPFSIAQEKLVSATPWVSKLRTLAAAVTLLVVGAAGGLLTGQLIPKNLSQIETVAMLAMNAHNVYSIDKNHPVEVPASQSQHLVKWLSKRLGTQLIAPDVSDLEFNLVGGRLLAATESAAAQFMYENLDGERVTLFVTPNHSNEQAGLEFTTREKTGAVYWVDSSLNYTLVGNIPKDLLLKLATDISNEWQQAI